MNGAMLISSFLTAALFLGEAQPGKSQPELHQTSVDPRLEYDLREKCGQDVRAWFKHFFGDGSGARADGSWTANYTNHYDSLTNRCYALLSSTTTIRDDKTKKPRVAEARTLVDVNDNKDVGNYFKFADMDLSMQCSVGEQKCTLLDQWENLVAPYMGR